MTQLSVPPHSPSTKSSPPNPFPLLCFSLLYRFLRPCCFSDDIPPNASTCSGNWFQWEKSTRVQKTQTFVNILNQHPAQSVDWTINEVDSQSDVTGERHLQRNSGILLNKIPQSSSNVCPELSSESLKHMKMCQPPHAQVMEPGLRTCTPFSWIRSHIFYFLYQYSWSEDLLLTWHHPI